MADLPGSRLSMETSAFFYTGVDYFGAINVKQSRGIIKCYGCLFLHDSSCGPPGDNLFYVNELLYFSAEKIHFSLRKRCLSPTSAAT